MCKSLDLILNVGVGVGIVSCINNGTVFFYEN